MNAFIQQGSIKLIATLNIYILTKDFYFKFIHQRIMKKAAHVFLTFIIKKKCLLNSKSAC